MWKVEDTQIGSKSVEKPPKRLELKIPRWLVLGQKNAHLQKFSHFPNPKMTRFKDRNSLGGRGPSAAIASFLNIQVLSFNLFTEEYPDMRKQDRQSGMVLRFLPPLVCPFFLAMLRFSRLDELVKFGEKVLKGRR